MIAKWGEHYLDATDGYTRIEYKARLADVLLAIRNSGDYGHYVPSVDCEGYFRAETGVVIGDENGDMQWNLRADDLEQQSPETINFLYSLLS